MPIDNSYGNLVSAANGGKNYRVQTTAPRFADEAQNWAGLAGASSAGKSNVERAQIESPYGLEAQAVQSAGQIAASALNASSALGQVGLQVVQRKGEADQALKLEMAKRGDRKLFMALGSTAALGKLAFPGPKITGGTDGLGTIASPTTTPLEPLPAMGSGLTAAPATAAADAGDAIGTAVRRVPTADAIVSGYAGDLFGAPSPQREQVSDLWKGKGSEDFSKYSPANVTTEGNLYADNFGLQGFSSLITQQPPTQQPQEQAQPQIAHSATPGAGDGTPSTSTAEGAIGQQIGSRTRFRPQLG